jgi:adenosylmethionine---8-amino-7-oxononanoate aminotransferase
MSDLLILGTDTDAGKTSFAIAWLTAFAEQYEYWKPLETGASDTATVQRAVPRAKVHPPLQSFAAPVAPLLASRQEKRTIPPARDIAGARPQPAKGKWLLVESFGSPFSPLNENELQIALIRALCMPSVLVTSSAVGAIGRSLQCLRALAVSAIEPVAVVLIGDDDPFPLEQLGKYWKRDRVWCQASRERQRPENASALEDLKKHLQALTPYELRSLTLPARLA